MHVIILQITKRHCIKVHTNGDRQTSLKPFKCEICNYASNNTSNYRRHCKTVHTNGDSKTSLKSPKYQCDYCPKQFKGKFLFQIHTRNHTGEKPFKCEICNYASNNPSNYKRHCKKVH